MDTQGKAERRWEQLEAQRRRARRLNELNVKASQRLHRKSARSALAAFRQKSIDGVSLATTVGMRRGEDDGKEGGGENEDQKENDGQEGGGGDEDKTEDDGDDGGEEDDCWKEETEKGEKESCGSERGPMTFTAAKLACEAKGTTLLLSNLQARLNTLCAGVWVGAREKVGAAGDFEFLDGTDISESQDAGPCLTCPSWGM